MSSIIAESGSSRKPQLTSKLPMPSCVASGMRGIHSPIVTSKARDSGGSPSSCQNARTASPSAAAIVRLASAPAVLRENDRIPTRPLTAAPRPGSNGMSQM